MRTIRPLSVALFGLAVAWLVTPHAVPLYDGVGFPDEPYRYVSPPAGYQKTPPPTRGEGSSAILDGRNTKPVYLDSSEQGPQVAMLIPDHVLTGPPAAKTFTVVATPLAPDTQPALTRVDGNVYRLTALADGRPDASFTRGPTGTVQLRATTARQPGPVMLHRASAFGQWQQLATQRIGNDIYESALAGAGDYALAFDLGHVSADGSAGKGAASAGGAPRGASGFPTAQVVVIVVLIALMAGVVLAVRLARLRESAGG